MKRVHRRYLATVRDEMVAKATLMTTLAMSYRNFRVGCAILAWRSDGTRNGEYRIFTGFNVKAEEGIVKLCSERFALWKILEEGSSGHPFTVIGLIVVGEPQKDDDSGLESNALLPCKVCCDYMESLQKHWKGRILIPNDTIVSSLNAHTGTTEQTTVGKLISLHKTNGGDQD